MDRGLLRKDEIWCVERRTGKGSRLYSLDAFSDVRTMRLRKRRAMRGS